jgi:hypothetical protein
MGSWLRKFLCRIGAHNFIKIRKEKTVGESIINGVEVDCVKTISYELECSYCGFKKPVTENFYGDSKIRKEIIVNKFYSDYGLSLSDGTSLTVNNDIVINTGKGSI